MTRPNHRSLVRLPMLQTAAPALERCAFCPKLCRAACPVSNAEPRETLTPWGKMSMAYLLGRDAVPLTLEFAAPAWACSGCYACRDACEHKNDVPAALFQARAAIATEGHAPEVMTRFLDSRKRMAPHLRQHIFERFASMPQVDAQSTTAIVLGCAHCTHHARASQTAIDAIRSTAALEKTRVAVIDECCGAPLLHAGDSAGFAEQSERFASRLSGKSKAVVIDAGCAATIKMHFAHNQKKHLPPVLHFAEFAARHLSSLRAVDSMQGTIVRYHDPCQLGRGIGVYDEPRDVLARALGRRPDEFARHRNDAQCSGGGGLLPLTMPRIARDIAAVRIAEHTRSEGSGGVIVTACASSARMFRKQGASAVDLASVVARSLGV